MVLKSIRKDLYFDDGEEMPVNVRVLNQERELHRFTVHAWKNAMYTRELMERVWARPEDINGVKSLPKLSIIRKAELLDRQQALPPYGGFLAVNFDEIARVFVSAAGISQPLPSTKIKWFERALWAAGFRKGDSVLSAFDYTLTPEGRPIEETLQSFGAAVFDAGSGDAAAALGAMLAHRTNGYVGPAAFLLEMIKTAEAAAANFRNDYPLERAFFTGEMLTPDTRKTLEENYGIDTRQAYLEPDLGGLVGYECPLKSGFHISDDYILEIVDAEGKQLKPGQVGEIVLTPINNKAWGLIRYGTGEKAAVTTAPCPCGRSSYRLVGLQQSAVNC
jgi:phenylacetate-CoA ligase